MRLARPIRRRSRASSAIRLRRARATLFDRVRTGAFDERLFYRLNVMHIVVKEKKDALGAS
jgi:transcriptional regulator of acetoin/glycerol metabolism